MPNINLPSPARLLLAAPLLLLLQAPAARAAAAGPWALFDGSAAISDPDANDPVNVELGVRFTVDAPATGAYWLSKVRYWRSPDRPINTNRVNVYDANGQMVARGSYDVANGASGAVDVPLAGAPAADAGQDLYGELLRADRALRARPRGVASPRAVGPVHFPPDAGVYHYGGGFPTSSWQSTSYYVSPLVAVDT